MICQVTIVGSKGAGEVVTSGELTFDKYGFELKYEIDGDRCVLSAYRSTVTQSRRGNFNTDITFSKGKDTVCMLLSGELTGSIPVKTTRLDILKSEYGVTVSIDYFLGGAKINLRLSAVVTA